ncbi:MAG: T9SS type A sorting domain-containing protein [Flavobacteriales bacterium]|jgi:acetyl esterase/lipase|nr:T9SS type A sorting domain-containing protein [Flavobacteriales bacterium]MCB0758396.1 T9SS type A sorting domain-containing protein [Flavobacteriales bacterium]
MTKNLLRAIPLAALALTVQVHAQDRYLSEIFTDAQVTITNDVIFGTNIDFLRSSFADPNLYGPEVIQLQTLVSTSQPIPAPFFDPQDPSTVVKVEALKMDIYEPDQAVDGENARPVFIFVHTGNALPPPLNGSPNGTRKDSSAVEICKQMARRGYVAVSMSYRAGWNPLGSTVEIRRGTLLNAIYRAIHDVKQCVRTMKATAAGANIYAIDASKIILYGEGTGGYITLATVTLDDPSELLIDKFLPDPFEPDVSYVDSTTVGNIEGFGGSLTLYRPNGFDSDVNFCVNAGGALADTSWLAPGDVPMVSFHTVFDPFAPFGDGIVIVPTTGEQVVPVQGSNVFMELVNQYGNNSSFTNLVGNDPYTTRARSLYDTDQTHGTNTVHINANNEGLYPLVTPNWPAQIPGTLEEASPWQWWDPDGALAQTVVAPGPPPITAGQASQASNPNFGPGKGRMYIDTIMGYMNPRIVCALDLGPCGLVSIADSDPIAVGVELFPNPAHDVVRISSATATIRMVDVYDINGRRVHSENVENKAFNLHRYDLKAGAYFVTLTFDQGTVTRKLMLD